MPLCRRVEEGVAELQDARRCHPCKREQWEEVAEELLRGGWRRSGRNVPSMGAPPEAGPPQRLHQHPARCSTCCYRRLKQGARQPLPCFLRGGVRLERRARPAPPPGACLKREGDLGYATSRSGPRATASRQRELRNGVSARAGVAPSAPPPTLSAPSPVDSSRAGGVAGAPELSKTAAPVPAAPPPSPSLSEVPPPLALSMDASQGGWGTLQAALGTGGVRGALAARGRRR